MFTPASISSVGVVAGSDRVWGVAMMRFSVTCAAQ